jgi:flagellar hook-associated protein 2
MSIASFSGLASGVQWRDLLDQVMRAETAKRITPVEREAGAEQQRINALNRYRDLVGKLDTAAQALKDGRPFGKFTVSGGDSAQTGRTLLSASASASAQTGSYTVRVLSLARTQAMATSPQSSSNDPLSLSGSFEINGKTITVDAVDSLAQLRDRINAADAGVTASVFMAAPGDYRLTLTSRTAGENTIGLVDGAGSVAAALGLHTTVDGSDARILVNGIAVTRQSNSLDDVIEGVTLNLQHAEPDADIELRVARDDSAMMDAVKAFVTAYNDIRSFVDQQTGSASQPLARSAVLRSSLNSFKEVLLSDVLDPENVPLTRLGSIGLTLSRNGILELDEAKLRDGVAGHLSSVQMLLAEAGSRLASATAQTTRADTGPIATQVRSHNDSITSLNRRADELRDRLDRQYERMERDFIRMESALLQIQSQGNWLTQQINAMQPAKR